MTQAFGNRPCAPLFVTVNVTEKCNLNCPYCFQAPLSGESLPLDDFTRIVHDLARAKVFFIVISGGEPFLHPQISEILREAHTTFQHVVTITNGTVLGTEHFDTIKQIAHDKGGFPIQVSLDDCSTEVNERTRRDTDLVLSNMSRLRELGASITVASVLTKLNKDTIVDSLRGLLTVTRSFHLMPVKRVKRLDGTDEHLQLSHGELDEIWSKVAGLKKEYGLSITLPCEFEERQMDLSFSATGAPCMAGFSTLVIDPNLNVRPCDRLKEAVVGNLRTESLAEIWESETLLAMLATSMPYCKFS